MNPCTLCAHPKKKEAKNFDLQARKPLPEVHVNRPHLPPYSEGTPDLKGWLISLNLRLEGACYVRGFY